MRTIRRTLLGLGALLAAFVGVVVAAALANWLTIDNRNFSSQADVRGIQKTAGGGECVRRYASRSERLRVMARTGPVTCLFRLPVSADGPQPDQAWIAHGRIPTAVPQGVRNNAELLLRVRSGGGTYVELRVKPVGREWVVRRHNGEGPVAIGSGSDGAIGRPGQLNRMRLEVAGDGVQAVVNGSNLLGGAQPIPDSGQVTGKTVELGVRHGATTQTSLPAPFDLLRLRIPDPR